jgi:hypothetical protein
MEAGLERLLEFLGECLSPRVATFAAARVSESRHHGEFDLPSWVKVRFIAGMCALGYDD